MDVEALAEKVAERLFLNDRDGELAVCDAAGQQHSVWLFDDASEGILAILRDNINRVKGE